MLYKTHKAGGTLVMLVAFEYFRAKNMLLPGLNDFVQLAIMYPASSWGATAPDLDHHKGAVKEQTPFNLLLHRVLHLFDVRHRSWQTHSITVTGGACAIILLLIGILNGTIHNVNSADWMLIRLIVVGATLGIISHLICDAFSMDGIYLGVATKVRFVPRIHIFATGGTYELIFQKILYSGIFLAVINLILNQFNSSIFKVVKILIKTIQK